MHFLENATEVHNKHEFCWKTGRDVKASFWPTNDILLLVGQKDIKNALFYNLGAFAGFRFCECFEKA